MPTPAKAAGKVTEGGKHRTKAEIESRQTAGDDLARERRTYLQAPGWLTEEARAIWEDTKKKLAGIKLLDNADTTLLALYCDAVAKYQACSKRVSGGMNDTDTIKELQAWSRLVISFSDKLGLTPGGRARLAIKKTEKVKDPFAEEFGG